jgi:hypothetical protein
MQNNEDANLEEIETTDDSEVSATEENGAQISARGQGDEPDARETGEDSEPSKEGEDEGDEDPGKEAGAEGDPQRRPQLPRGAKKRIDKLTRRLSEREREIEYWKRRAMDEKSPNAGDSKTVPAQETSERPRAEDFETHEEYVEKLADWKVDQKLKEQETKTRQNQLQSDHQRRMGQHLERVKSFSEKHEDFLERMDEVDDIPMSVAVQELILDSENGPELMYELAKDPEEYERICKLPPLEAARAMGKFESRITAQRSSQRIVNKTKTPEPITPISSKRATSTKKSIFDESLNQREYERLMEEREAKRASSW